MDHVKRDTVLAAAIAAAAQSGQPQVLYDTLERGMDELIGHRLFTLMIYDERESTVRRVHSNQPAAYPPGGSKPYAASTLFDRLLQQRQPVVLRTAAEIEQGFVDHALIASLGCAAGLHLPVAYDGRTLGLMNLLHEAGWYTDEHVAAAAPFAALLTAPFLTALRGRS